MQVIMRDAGDPFADEVAWWLAQGLHITETGPDHVVLSPPDQPARWRRNRGHWWGRATRRRRAVRINMRARPATGPVGPDPTPARYQEGYGATWG